MSRDNLEEYQDPIAYDAEHTGYEPAGPFFEALAGEARGSVLELACGTGRITIPLAQRGFVVTGLDILPAMLARAQTKAAEAGVSVAWVEGDCTQFDLGSRRFRLIFMTGHGFQHLLDRPAQEALFERVRVHLEPDGLFAFETRNPYLPGELADTGEEYWHSFTDPQGRLVRTSGTQQYDPASQVITYTTFRRYGEGDAEVTQSSTIRLRYSYPEEIVALAERSGLPVEGRYGYWDRSPLSRDSREMIFVCRKRA